MIVGAGFIGLEVAAIARKLEKKVIILEGSSKVMGRNLSQKLSQWYIEYHKKKGVNFLFNETITSVNAEKNIINSIQTSNNNH